LPEAEKVADEIYSELSGEFPELINSALSGYGKELIEYKRKLDNPTQHLSGKEDANIPEIVLLDYEERKKALVKSLSIYNFSTGGEALPTQMMKLREMSLQDLGSVVAQLAGLRKNRRHKLHRAFESVSYLFQITTNYGAFRDMQRHRFISINRQFLTPLYGHDTPEAFMGDGEFTEIMRQGKELWRRISDSQGYAIAQYAVPYAFRYPVSAYLNLRELAFFCELRSTPQAHHDLRRIAIGMYDAVKGVHPELAALIRFVDSSSYALGRLRSEQAKEKKLRKLSER
ncbi:MAG: alternative thymidylate synthase, partial [Thermoplasmatales archaeon A-plasma]